MFRVVLLSGVKFNGLNVPLDLEVQSQVGKLPLCEGVKELQAERVPKPTDLELLILFLVGLIFLAPCELELLDSECLEELVVIGIPNQKAMKPYGQGIGHRVALRPNLKLDGVVLPPAVLRQVVPCLARDSCRRSEASANGEQ